MQRLSVAVEVTESGRRGDGYRTRSRDAVVGKLQKIEFLGLLSRYQRHPFSLPPRTCAIA